MSTNNKPNNTHIRQACIPKTMIALKSLHSKCQPVMRMYTLRASDLIVGLRASPPCRARWRDLASPLTRPWRKNRPTPLQTRNLDCQGSSNFRLHSQSSRVSIALAAPHSGASSTCDLVNRATFGNHVILLTIFREYSWFKSQYANNGGGVPP